MDVNVSPIKPENVVQVDETDAGIARDLIAAVVLLQQTLGQDREAYLARERELAVALDRARGEYAGHLRGMARRYVTGQGDFQFVPELGAFVGAPKQGE